MLTYRLLKNHAGILLIGDSTSLRWLHEVVHGVNERSPLVGDKEGMFLGLAYDARKAYERQREIIQPPAHYEEMGIRYGIQLLWPVLLLQQRTLWPSLTYLDHSAKTQAVAYALEAIIEEALQQDFTTQGKDAIALWQRFNPAQLDVFDKLQSRGAIFCSWTKAERKRNFLQLLTSFDPMYDSNHMFRLQRGERNLLSPGELELWASAEWPDTRWSTATSGEPQATPYHPCLEIWPKTISQGLQMAANTQTRVSGPPQGVAGCQRIVEELGAGVSCARRPSRASPNAARVTTY
ncbi:DUF6904 family protein [Mesorhizobium sangaii]|uniref:Uncharacterized protein n=1 Tax=Mesorhizobium sangaii TaxID=505389 RepID=A0A841PNZ9_9HYPH|nr:hypothetical protein [Mesorhizobium sangaii]MBB6414388.1 hypothetical protein [Mesorhizobium sangaii]